MSISQLERHINALETWLNKLYFIQIIVAILIVISIKYLIVRKVNKLLKVLNVADEEQLIPSVFWEYMRKKFGAGWSNSPVTVLNEEKKALQSLLLEKVETCTPGRKRMKSIFVAEIAKLSNEEIIELIKTSKVPVYRLEKILDNHYRAVVIRRELLNSISANKMDTKETLEMIPFKGYDYTKVIDNCCENIIGYVPVPLGLVGPLILDGKAYSIPFATTEGCLVATANRGCRVLSFSGTETYFSKLHNDSEIVFIFRRCAELCFR